MTEVTNEFSVVEKLAIVNAVDSVILADGHVHNAEINALGILMRHIDFDSNFIIHARNIEAKQSISILRGMLHEKKRPCSPF